MKSANMDYINKETTEFLGLPFVFGDSDYRGLFTESESVQVSLILYPEWDKWIKAMFQVSFATWHNEFGTNIDVVPDYKREELVLNFLKKRPVSAVLESAIFVFRIDGLSRAMTHQIVRHRGMAFNQQSLRVTPCHLSGIRMPKGLDEEDKADLEELFKKVTDKYLDLIDSGVPIEQARNVMPMGTLTNIVMVSNLKVLIGYLKARTLDIAQDEHTYIALLIANELRSKCPEFYTNFVKNDRIEKLFGVYGIC